MKNFLMGLFILILIVIYLPSTQAFASNEENAEYRIEKCFFRRRNANSALQQLRSATGWWAEIKPTGDYIPYYQVQSGGFNGEENAKSILNQFKSTTGL